MSWENDKFLVRGHDSDYANLAIGDPLVIQHRYDDFYAQTWRGCPPFTYPASTPYPPLERELRNLGFGEHIVVTTGAKQALYAAVYALVQTRRMTGYEYGTLNHTAPYWPSYSTIASSFGLGLRNDDLPVPNLDISVVTSPNNPDGSEVNPQGSRLYDIWDSAYAHGIYGWSGVVPNNRMAVWSASKMLGMSSIRVGWLTTNDKKLADLASQYVEQTTSGVSNQAQNAVYQVLEYSRFFPENIEHANKLIISDFTDNAQAFSKYLDKHCDEVYGRSVSGVGMFQWFKAKDPEKFSAALESAKVLMVPGVACGGKPGWYRMSLGHYPRVTKDALERVAKHNE